MSSVPAIDFTPLLEAVAVLFNSIATSLAGALPAIAPVLAAIAIIALLFAVGERIPVVGGVVRWIRESIGGLF